jgi:AhpD family alkylhydroperoxidase
MEPRFNYVKAARGAYEALLGLEKYLHQSGLEESLLNLVRLRASEINGCAYCIDMHWKDLRAVGETEQRLYGLDFMGGVALPYRPRTRGSRLDGSGDES